MKKVFFLLITILVLMASGCASNPSKISENINSQNILNCENKCSFSGEICFENEIRACEDRNWDGCLEEIFVSSCLWNEQCENGRCIVNPECKEGSCNRETLYIPSLDQVDYISDQSNYCGNSLCESSETCQNCYWDCGSCNRGNLSNGRSCDLDARCISGFCIHGTCRPSSTYCGDDYCEGRENCSSCSHDCGKCDVFSIGEAYSSSSDKIYETSYNRFNLIESGNSYSSVSIPITFNESAEDVTFSFFCNGIDGNSFSASSRKDSSEGADTWLIINQSNISLKAHFGRGSATQFILSNKKEYGTRIDSVGSGTVKIIMFIWNFPEKSMAIGCRFAVSSGSPSFTAYSTVEIFHNQ